MKHLRYMKPLMKTIYAVAGLGIIAYPEMAYAIGWSVQNEAAELGAGSSAQAMVQPGILSPLFVRAVNIIAGTAVAIFILRIIMTAVDRFLLAGATDIHFRLSDIPFIGAYPNPDDPYQPDETPKGKGNKNDGEVWTWGHIFKRFFIQMCIVAGAYAITRVVLEVIVLLSNVSGISA